MHSSVPITFLCLFSVYANAQNGPHGVWKAIDDTDGKATSHIEIFEKEGRLHGKVVRILSEPEDIVCRACEGEKKDQPILGMEILWGLENKGKSWKGGRIMDPGNGKTYKCKIELSDWDILEVRGYVGLPALGRTQKWLRMK